MNREELEREMRLLEDLIQTGKEVAEVEKDCFVVAILEDATVRYQIQLLQVKKQLDQLQELEKSNED